MEDYKHFVELYQKAESNKDTKKSNDLFIQCIVKSTELIQKYDEYNYLQLFRSGDEILNVYFKNAQLLTRTVGLNNEKITLTKNEDQTLQTVIHRLRKCLAIQPMNEDVIDLFRSVFVYLSRFQTEIKDKIIYLKQVLMINPIDHELHLHLGVYYMTINDLDNALLHYKHSWGILLFQKDVDNIKIKCLNNIGSIYSAIQDHNLAEYYFKEALKIKPNDPDINNQLGALHTELRNTEKAIKYYNTGIENIKEACISEDHQMLLASIHMNMGMAYCYECDFNQAITCYNTALKYKPSLSLAYQNKLLDLNYISHEIEDPMYVSKCHKAINRIYPNVITKRDSNYIIKTDLLKINNELNLEDKIKQLKNTNTKLNIGFVSGDFLHHPVSYFINAILKNLNTDIFNIFCFSGKNVVQSDSLKHCKFIITKNMSNVQLSDLIKSKNIDILFDLSAHTGDNRLDTFVLKPAPIQISYCGYPGSSGIRSMDYHITDTICDSKDTQKYYTEKLIFLKKCFLSYTPPTGFENLPAICITQPRDINGYITFGTLNRLNKINNKVISVWKKVLESIPTCKLIIKTKEFSTEKLKQAFLQNFSDVNDRIIVLEYTDTFEEHMNDYNKIDISLDTFPYSGTTTSCESLSMGVPIITLFDNIRYYHSQNVTSSILINSDLQDFVTYTEEEYIQKCINYSETNLSNLKIHTRNKFINGNVCDGISFTNEFEDTLINVYKNHNW